MDKAVRSKIEEYRGIIKYFEGQIAKLINEHGTDYGRIKNKKLDMITDPANSHISDAEMAKMIGCSRQYIWKLRRKESSDK